MTRLFSGTDGFYSPGVDASDLIARPKDFADNPLPSANSLAAEALVMHSAYTGEPTDHLGEIARGAGRLLERYPSSVGHLLAVLVSVDAGIREVAIVGDAAARDQLQQVIWESYRPTCVVAVGATDEDAVPLLHQRGTAAAAAAAHVCRNFVCELPVTTPTDLRSRLDG
jgi:uncharacterized protein YyaL (SSP411 family)